MAVSGLFWASTTQLRKLEYLIHFEGKWECEEGCCSLNFCNGIYQKCILWCWQRCSCNKPKTNERMNSPVQVKVFYTWGNLSFAFKILLAFCSMRTCFIRKLFRLSFSLHKIRSSSTILICSNILTCLNSIWGTLRTSLGLVSLWQISQISGVSVLFLFFFLLWQVVVFCDVKEEINAGA